MTMERVLYLIQCHPLMTSCSDDEMNGSGNSDSDFETVKPSDAVSMPLYLNVGLLLISTVSARLIFLRSLFLRRNTGNLLNI